VDAATGEQKWAYAAGAEVNAPVRIHGSQLYAGDMAGTLHALDPRAGTLLWRAQAGGPLLAAAAFREPYVFMAGGTGDGTLRALNPADGTLLWSYPTGAKVEADPVVADADLFLAGGDGKLYCFRIKAAPR
jgi:outer membrane protein assembly factor BamB